MKGLAFTSVYNDMVILELWLKYYSRWFEALHVMGLGTKAKYGSLEFLKKKYDFSFEKIEIDPTHDIFHAADVFVNTIREKQASFLESYDWVLYCNCDEYLVPSDPDKSLRDLMEKSDADYVHSEAFDVIQLESEGPIDYTRDYMSQRTSWVKNTSYNKTLLSRVPLAWNAGCHQIEGMSEDDSKQIKNTGLFLVHLKYSDLRPLGKRDFNDRSPNLESHLTDPEPDHIAKIPDFVRSAF